MTNPNGKILRIHPLASPGTTIGVGSTYSIPDGNLFDEELDTDNKTLPEIYAMGLRNPFTIGHARSDGELWLADRTMWWTYSAGSPTTPFEDLFGGGAMAGPIYTFDAADPSPSKFPAWFDNRYFFFDWTTDWVATASFNADGTVKDHRFFLPLHTFVKPMDMKFGADGALYVLAYGNGWGANCTKVAVTVSLGHNSHAHPYDAVHPGPTARAR